MIALTSGPNQITDFKTRDSLEVCGLMSATMAVMYDKNMPLINDSLVVVCPEHYRTLQRGGVNTKQQLQKALWHLSNKELAPRIIGVLRRAKPGVIGLLLGSIVWLIAAICRCLATLLLTLAPQFWQPLLRVHSLAFGSFVPKFENPKSLHVVVAGADAGKFSAFCPGFGVGRPPLSMAKLSSPVTMLVDSEVGVTAKAKAELLSGPQPETTLVDPTSDRCVVPRAPVQRLGKLRGTVALIDISKPQGSILLDRVQSTLVATTAVATKRYCKPTFSRPAPTALCELIRNECSCAIIALAD